MNDLFATTFFISLLLLTIGLFKPATVIRWGDPETRNRKKVLKTYLSITLVSFIGFGMTMDPSKNQINGSTPASTTVSPSDDKQQKEAQKQQAEKEKKEKLDAALSHLTKEKDDVTDTTWYKGYNLENNNFNGISTYIGQKNGAVALRYVLSYHGQDWIFFEKIYIKTENKTHEFDIPTYKKESKVLFGNGVVEYFDGQVDRTKVYEALKDLSAAQNATLRLSGQHHKEDYTVTQEQKQAIKYTIDAFEGFGGKI